MIKLEVFVEVIDRQPALKLYMNGLHELTFINDRFNDAMRRIVAYLDKRGYAPTLEWKLSNRGTLVSETYPLPAAPAELEAKLKAVEKEATDCRLLAQSRAQTIETMMAEKRELGKQIAALEAANTEANKQRDEWESDYKALHTSIQDAVGKHDKEAWL